MTGGRQCEVVGKLGKQSLPKPVVISDMPFVTLVHQHTAAAGLGHAVAADVVPMAVSQQQHALPAIPQVGKFTGSAGSKPSIKKHVIVLRLP